MVDNKVKQVVINKLTSAQYKTATINPNEFYIITDAPNSNNIIIKNSNVSNWVEEGSPYVDFPYVGTISVDGITENDYANVTFDYAQVISGDYCPLCSTGNNSVLIYSKKSDTITVPSILISKI